MSDLLDQLDELGPTPAIDVDAGWRRLQRRVHRRTAAQRGLAGVGVVALLAGGFVLLSSGDDGQTTRLTTASTTAPPSTQAGWSQLPNMPIEPRINPAMAEMDDGDLFVWGGYTPGSVGLQLYDGAVYDAGSETWQVLPPAPDVTVNEARAVFTGEVVVVTPSSGGEGTPMVWDPATDTWRVGAAGRTGCDVNRDPVWTGTEIMVACQDKGIDAYDPSADQWRSLPASPDVLTEFALAWTGDRLIVFGRSEPYTLPAGDGVGYSYDPATDEWQTLPPSGLNAQATDMTWNGTDLVVVDYSMTAAAYNPALDSWRDLPALPLRGGECSPLLVSARGLAIADLCTGSAILGPDDRWTLVPTRGAGAIGFATGAASGTNAVVSSAGEEGLFAYTPPVPDNDGHVPFEAPVPLGISIFSPPPGGEIQSVGLETADGADTVRLALTLADGTRCEAVSAYVGLSDSDGLTDGEERVEIVTADGWTGSAAVGRLTPGMVTVAWYWNADRTTDRQEAVCPTLEQAVQLAEGFDSPA
jgi:hypothetical protein